MKFKIDGSNGKIAKKLKELIPEDWKENNSDHDLLFRTKKESDSNKRIIDLTSKSKQDNDPEFSYGFPLRTYYENISIPGCSALLVLQALNNIKSFVDNIQVQVNFPLSAIKENSPNRKEVLKKKIVKLSTHHFHQNEIEKFLNKKISYETILEKRETCLLIKIKFSSFLKEEDLIKLIQSDVILNKEINFVELTNSNSIHFTLKKKNNLFELDCSFDNIHFVCDYAMSLAKKLLL